MNLRHAERAAVAAARAAGALMRKNLTAKKNVNALTAHDVKLELDVRCQELIERQLGKAFPDVAFLGEEGDAGDANAPFRWVVDPIDGTVNFFYGFPHSSVSIALQRKLKTRNSKHETILGVVYDPFMNELWTALRGGPARLNGRVIQVSRRRRLADCIVAIGFAKDGVSLRHALPYVGWLVRHVRKVRMLGSAALDLTYVATGRLDAYIERSINLWDIAAGGLIVECAGGRCWTQPIPDGKFRMIASNGKVRDQLKIPL